MKLDDIFKNGFENFLILVVSVSAVCVIIWLSIEKKIDRFNMTYPDRAVSKVFVSSAVRFAYTLIGFLIVFSQIKAFDPVMDVLFSTGGVLAICVTFAARESLANYIAGFLLAIHKPFRIGEKINLKSIKVAGVVEDITFRHTIIRTENGSVVTVPNAIMNSISIEDLTEVKKPKQKKSRPSSGK